VVSNLTYHLTFPIDNPKLAGQPFQEDAFFHINRSRIGSTALIWPGKAFVRFNSRSILIDMPFFRACS